MKLFKWSMIALAIALLPHVQAQAGFITVSRLNTDDIVIPVFDTNLGTLTDVQLTITLLPGVTTPGGSHDHPTYSLLSSNSFSSATGMSTIAISSSTVGPSAHSVTSPTYSGGGLNIGSFSFGTSSDGAHNHVVQISPGGYTIIGLNAYLARAIVDTLPAGNHSSSYGGTGKVLNYSGLDVTPFLAPGDITISAGTFTTSSEGSHSHLLPGFTIGPWSFGSSLLSTSGSHAHALDPRFNVFAEFTYTEASAVPEPSSLALLGSGLTCCIGAAVRRRRSQVSEILG